MGEIGRENGAKLASKLNKLKILCLISAKAQNYYFSNRFYCFFEAQGVHVGRKNRSWSVLEASWGVLEASEGVLEASWGILKPFGGVFRRLRGVWRRQVSL